MGKGRKNKDKIIGNERKNFIDWMQEKDWYILNGTTEGNWEGELMYIGARDSTMDYAMVNEKLDRVDVFTIGDKVDSNHMPIMIEIETVEGRKQDREVQEEKNKNY